MELVMNSQTFHLQSKMKLKKIGNILIGKLLTFHVIQANEK